MTTERNGFRLVEVEVDPYVALINDVLGKLSEKWIRVREEEMDTKGAIRRELMCEIAELIEDVGEKHGEENVRIRPVLLLYKREEDNE